MNPFANFNQENNGRDSKFKSTKVWNDIVYAFCVGIEVKKHRRQFRAYEDCFPAKQAVTWIHNYLARNPQFGEHQVSRHQAVLLLRKFVQFDIIKRVELKENDIDDQELQDNRDLYCFTKSVSENLPVHPPENFTRTKCDQSTQSEVSSGYASISRSMRASRASFGMGSRVLSPILTEEQIQQAQNIRRGLRPSAIDSTSSLGSRALSPILSDSQIARRSECQMSRSSSSADHRPPAGIAMIDDRVAVFLPKGCDYAPVTVFSLPVTTSTSAFTYYV